MFNVDWEKRPFFTAVPDSFISKYLPDAPGNYVKLFIYLLMISQSGRSYDDAEAIEDILGLSKSELYDALKYWEEKKLLKVNYRSGKPEEVNIRLDFLRRENGSHRLSQSRVNELSNDNNDVKTLCFVAEKYIGHPLSTTELCTILYFWDELKFPVDLCEYLIEYCVSKGHRSIRYIEKVGLAWHKEGYRTVEEAKQNSSRWSKIHFDVLKAFGISGRNPVEREIEYIDKWYKVYGFSLDIISEACSIALSKTGKQSFAYADSVLSSWFNSGVKTLSDARKINSEFKKQHTASASTRGKNHFLNYQQRDDDLYELERKLDMQFAQITEASDGTD